VDLCSPLHSGFCAGRTGTVNAVTVGGSKEENKAIRPGRSGQLAAVPARTAPLADTAARTAPLADVPARTAPLAPGSGRRQVFAGQERELGELRQWLAGLLPDCPARDDVVSVATELGTNAVRHTATGRGGWFTVQIHWHRAKVRVAVGDDGAPSGPRVIDDPLGERGRGLLMVRALATHVGVSGDRYGRLVWADIPWPDQPRAEPR
jgi:anti-sigma regulatory factor (Ser/Thr protein kinase)